MKFLYVEIQMGVLTSGPILYIFLFFFLFPLFFLNQPIRALYFKNTLSSLSLSLSLFLCGSISPALFAVQVASISLFFFFFPFFSLVHTLKLLPPFRYCRLAKTQHAPHTWKEQPSTIRPPKFRPEMASCVAYTCSLSHCLSSPFFVNFGAVWPVFMVKSVSFEPVFNDLQNSAPLARWIIVVRKWVTIPIMPSMTFFG